MYTLKMNLGKFIIIILITIIIYYYYLERGVKDERIPV